MNRRNRRLKSIVVASALLALLAAFAGQGASAARVATERALPQAYLLKLDEPSTVRAFRLNRGDGLGAARSAAREQKSEIREAQAEVIGELPAGADPIYRTHSVLAGVGVNATTADRETLGAIAGVTAAYPIVPKSMENAYAVPFQNGAAAWQATGFTGQGQTIAVIDSGLDYTHSAFGGPGTVLAYEQAQADEDLAPDPLSFDPDKLVGGIDLVGDDYDAASDDEAMTIPHPDPNPLDCGGHGSHVAGSAAAFGVNADGSTYEGPYDDSTDFGAMKIGPGVAPEAGIYAIKVFGCDGSTSVVTEAIDKAVDPNGDGDPSDRVDVINLSLGSDFGSVQDADSVAADAAVQMGVSVVAAAGNAGDVTDITGSPGDAPRVLSVASSVDAESKEDAINLTIDGNPEQFGITRAVQYDWKNGADLSGPVVAAPAENEDACAPYEGTPFTGQVVLVKWHDAVPECPSAQRGDNLAAAGAVGYIFGSDSPTITSGINGDDEIPGVLVVAEGTEAIRNALESNHVVTVDGTEINAITKTVTEDNDKASSFTSRGIHAVGNVKPDVAAVGSTVFSVAVGAGSEGTSNSGTSMASPMVAGLAALVRQANPDWTPLQVKAGIMNSAIHDLFVDGSANPASGQYGPPRVGAGRIDAELATTGEVLAYDAVKGAVSASFGPVEVSAPVNLSREVTVDNQSASSITYDLEYDPINEVPGAEFSVSPAQITLDPGETTSVAVSLEIADPSELTKAVDPTLGRLSSVGTPPLPRETLAEAFGRLLLEPTGPGTDIRVPVYASPRPASTMSQPEDLKIHRTAATATDPVQTAALTLSGQGVGGGNGDNGVGDGDPDNDIFSIAAGYELQATSGQAPECTEEIETACWRLPEEKYSDLKAVGYTSNAGYVSNPASARAYFVAAVHAPWAIPSDKGQIQFDLDVDRDGVTDLYLFNGRSGEEDVFVSILFDPAKPDGQRVISRLALNGRFGNIDTALYDSDVMVLPVSLPALEDYGVDSENPRIDYGVEAYSYFSGQPIDLIGAEPGDGETESTLTDPLSANLHEPGITVRDEGGLGPLVDDQPGADLTVTRNPSSYEEDDGLGVLMVHFHNAVGAKTGIVSLSGAESATRLFVSPTNLTARVDAVGEGLPVPTGEVRFEVDGQLVGQASVENGVAVLEHEVPSGATREVKAIYSGDYDFEPSSDQAGRSDPVLKARITSKAKKNRFGWYRKPVTVSFQCQTNGSDLVEDCPYPRRVTRDGRGLEVRASIVAFDGGRASVRVRGINIDRTRPVVKIRGVRRGGTYKRIRRARCVARDRTSGMRSCVIRWKRQGKRVTYVATATDRAGNRRTVRLRTRLLR